jgi:hypothetical protein
VLAGVITPFAERSLKTNQLPGGSMLWILSDAPSESKRPVGLIAGGALEPLAADDSVVLAEVVLAVALAVEDPPDGHCACGGAMQLAAAKTRTPPTAVATCFFMM